MLGGRLGSPPGRPTSGFCTGSLSSGRLPWGCESAANSPRPVAFRGQSRRTSPASFWVTLAFNCPGIETQGLRLPRLMSQPVPPDFIALTSKTRGRGWPGLRNGASRVGGGWGGHAAWTERGGLVVPQGESGCSDRKQLRTVAHRRTRVPPTAPRLSHAPPPCSGLSPQSVCRSPISVKPRLPSQLPHTIGPVTECSRFLSALIKMV